MHWNQLTNIDQLDLIDEESKGTKVMVFKHSTRCGISAMVFGRMERTWKEENGSVLIPYYLDLLTFRNISDAVAKKYGVTHQSPQVLVISDGKCVFELTHNEINLEEILKT